MKCPKCGYEIPEGHMYCDNCGMEINFVPDFEPEVENQINATLSEVADELNKEERLKREKREKAVQAVKFVLNKWKYIVCGIAAIFAVVCCVMLYLIFSGKSAIHYMRAAEKAKSAGDMDEAISVLIDGNNSIPDNADIIFRLSDYYLEQGKSEEAVDALKKITNSALFSESSIVTAYESIISIYESTGEFSKISEILNENTDELANEFRKKYVPEKPVMTPAGGEFEGEVTVSLQKADAQEGTVIYYTVNGDDPDSSSIVYENDIILDSEGDYVIKAACINNYGIPSQIVENTYKVVRTAPKAPEIMEPSGEYNQNTMIVAVAEAGCSIFYTTDGSDPTVESKQYISPITMPVGTSHYRFVAISNDGEVSEIVDRDYHLVYTRLVTTEQAVNMLVSTLVRLDILLDNSGKVRGVDGHNEYIYNTIIEIEGAGEYYVVVENHVNNDGTSAPTGLIYAVNTHDGSVNRLGYDSSGKYTLIKISNR
jgi:tetratricopeptide (TPR) repeat protein